MSTTPETDPSRPAVPTPPARPSTVGEPAVPNTPTRRLARLITDLLAPVHLVIALLPVIGLRSGDGLDGLVRTLPAVVFCGGLPLLVVLVGIRRGVWSDRHVRVREQRAVPLLITLGSVLVGLGVSAALGTPRPVLALIVAMVTGLLVTIAVTAWWKVSVHAAVAAGATAALIVEFGAPAWALLPVTAAIGWSRVVLRDHTPAQVMVGTVLGFAVAASVFALLR
ncbi:hypothetical protein [Streptomyces sp. ST2-7A]|uniref:hypothetical protein n=1 Tax=Streptomyces sp. ST2-7A TaxID=2907214 RepID=UPI001F1BC15D|nr:hypothetical protein [Streptomyces sp. ST2-7A]MCE7083016.1 hypothetical protein [Streptomyces sp. ST2-7A]